MIKNKTKNKIICNNFELRKNLLGQIRGLMFSSRNNLIFTFKKEKKVSLHNFFVFFPIDIVLCNAKKRVIEIKKNFRPFSPSFQGKNKAKYVLELEDGSIDKANIAIGDQLNF